jgi:two-component system, OmpR family, KDP operon response regulator KdpE
MEQRSKVLVVEDDAAIRQSLFETLGVLGFAVGEANSSEEAMERLSMVDYDVVLLDINMPGMGGVEACRRFSQQHSRLPIIVLSVSDKESDKVDALDAGADDYVTKPYPIRELAARLCSVIRRSRVPTMRTDIANTIGGILLDPVRRRVEKMGEEIHLTPKEFEMLRYLMDHAGRPIPHQRLLSTIWGPNARKCLRVHINQLRKKIEDDPAHPTYILTDSHVGYRFREA